MKKLVFSTKNYSRVKYSDKNYVNKEYLLFPFLNIMDKVTVFIYCLYLGYRFTYSEEEKKAIVITRDDNIGFIQKNERDIYIVYKNSNNFREVIDTKLIYNGLKRRYGQEKLDKIISQYMLNVITA